MTDTPTAGLEKRLREMPVRNGDGSQCSCETCMTQVQAADALAKARAALEAVQFIEYMDGNIGTRCAVCGGRTEHGMSCNIGAALEAMR